MTDRLPSPIGPAPAAGGGCERRRGLVHMNGRGIFRSFTEHHGPRPLCACGREAGGESAGGMRWRSVMGGRGAHTFVYFKHRHRHREAGHRRQQIAKDRAPKLHAPSSKCTRPVACPRQKEGTPTVESTNTPWLNTTSCALPALPPDAPPCTRPCRDRVSARGDADMTAPATACSRGEAWCAPKDGSPSIDKRHKRRPASARARRPTPPCPPSGPAPY